MKTGISEAFLIDVLQHKDSILEKINENLRTLSEFRNDSAYEEEAIRTFYLPNPSVLREDGRYRSGNVPDLSDLYLKFERRKKRQDKEMQQMVEELVELRSQVEHIWMCYLILPYPQQKLLNMYYLEGRKMADIAEELNCSIKTIYVRRTGAMNQLKRMCESGLSSDVLIRIQQVSDSSAGIFWPAEKERKKKSCIPKTSVKI